MEFVLTRLQIAQGRPVEVLDSCVPSSSGRPHLQAARCSTDHSKGLRKAGYQLHGRGLTVKTQATAQAEEEDLIQFPDRENWYKAKFVADDAPDWNAGRFVRSREAAPNLREITLEIEISREKVPLRNGYRHIGQSAVVRVNGGSEITLPVASSPFPLLLNKDPLFKARNDLFAGAIKLVTEEISLMEPLVLLVPKSDDNAEAFNLTEGDSVEIGPFQGTGINLRGPIRSIWAYPTLVIFCEGMGIAAARSLIEADVEVGSLNLPLRQEVRMYYRAPNQEALLYKDRYEAWEALGCKVITSTRDTFMDMFDNDDTLAYEPASTAAVILTGGDEEAEAAALEVCKEAEITEIARDSVQQAPTIYLTAGK